MPGIIDYDPDTRSRLVRPLESDVADFTLDDNNARGDTLVPTGLTSPWGATGGTRPAILYADLIIIP